MRQPWKNPAACLIISLAAVPLAANGPDLLAVADGDERLRQTIEYLASFDSRMTGQPGNAQAADWLEAQLQALGLGTVRREAFPVTIPSEVGTGSLFVEEWGESARLFGLWPNGARTTTVSPEGVRAPLVWGGSGEYEELDGRAVNGRIILMEFNSWDHWIRLAGLGARAIVFVEPEGTS